MAESALTIRRVGEIALLRPAPGVRQPVEELEAVIEELLDDAACRALVLLLEGDPVLALEDPAAEELVLHARRVQAVLDRIERGGKPAVGAILGDLRGDGLPLALACHLLVAAEGARLGPFAGPLTGLGTLPRLLRRLGRRGAGLLALTPVEREAADFCELHAPPEECETAALALAEAASGRPVAETEALLEGLVASADLPLDDALELDAQLAGLARARRQEG